MGLKLVPLVFLLFSICLCGQNLSLTGKYVNVNLNTGEDMTYTLIKGVGTEGIRFVDRDQQLTIPFSEINWIETGKRIVVFDDKGNQSVIPKQFSDYKRGDPGKWTQDLIITKNGDSIACVTVGIRPHQVYWRREGNKLAGSLNFEQLSHFYKDGMRYKVSANYPYGTIVKPTRQPDQIVSAAGESIKCSIQRIREGNIYYKIQRPGPDPRAVDHLGNTDGFCWNDMDFTVMPDLTIVISEPAQFIRLGGTLLSSNDQLEYNSSPWLNKRKVKYQIWAGLGFTVAGGHRRRHPGR